MTGHTPGPWSIGIDLTVVNIPHRGPHCVTSTYAGTRENARLIAAAPDLFEALQWALSELRGSTRYDNPQQALNCFDKADEAIAKVTAA